MKSLIQRAKEPSTWAGLAVLVPFIPGLGLAEFTAVTTAIQAVAAAVAIFMPETGRA